LVRLFIIQHDCGHGSFLASRGANDAIGRCLGVLTLTPYRYWRRFHALHHATSGKLEERGSYDIKTLTVQEYRSLSPLARIGYRLYRHPAFLLGLAPALMFLVLHRLPWLAPADWPAERRSILGTDLALLLVFGGAGLALGFERVALVLLPIVLVAGAVGVGIFYVQHQFEEAYWEPKARWRFEDAGLRGSSYLDLPGPLAWFTGNIGLHHVHHLSTRIPNYRLPECLKANRDLQATRLTLRDCIHCFALKLWDERSGRLVPFHEVARDG
jgi:omega-6 fatty acid desaturase (delta-12 desaturase)